MLSNAGMFQMSSSYPPKACWPASGLFANVQRANVTKQQAASSKQQANIEVAQWQMQAEARQGKGRDKEVVPCWGKLSTTKPSLCHREERGYFYEHYMWEFSWNWNPSWMLALMRPNWKVVWSDTVGLWNELVYQWYQLQCCQCDADVRETLKKHKDNGHLSRCLIPPSRSTQMHLIILTITSNALVDEQCNS